MKKAEFRIQNPEFRIINFILLCFVLVSGARGATFTPSGTPRPAAPPVIGGAATGIVAPGKNLIKNGDFEKGTTWPEGWEKTSAPGATIKTSAGVMIEQVEGGAGHGRVLHMKMDRAAADEPGMMLLSEPIPVTAGKTYHISVEVKSMGPSVNLFVKGYGDYQAKSKSMSGKEVAIYEKKQQSRIKTGEWGIMSFDFTPEYKLASEAAKRIYAKRGVTIPTVNRVRVELFAFHPAGEVYFDNVRVTGGATAEKAYITAPEAKKP